MNILAIDQGTTGTTAVLIDQHGNVADKAYQEIPQIYPKKSWVEHDPVAIWDSVVATVSELLAKNPVAIEAVGITNQRETIVVWDKTTGTPIYNAIVWQCRRTAEYCETMQEHRKMIKAKTGLPLDAYFSATKIRWILDHCDYSSVENLLCGTIDTWLIYKLTEGASHCTDHTNASRTMLFNIHTRTWDSELLTLFDIPRTMLPSVNPSQADFGTISAIDVLKEVPILGVAGDQQAALFGQGCYNKGEVKNTYGTGCFMLMQCEDHYVESHKGLITTLACDAKGAPSYALEGSVFSAGSVIQWLRDELGILQNAHESEAMALKVEDSNEVYFVPAFNGLGSPYWDMHAKASITGITRDSNRYHITRAALESIAYQSNDLLSVMKEESGFELTTLKVDGGASQNDFLMQFQADITHTTILRSANVESTALGAGYLAGLQKGVWNAPSDIKALSDEYTTFEPHMEETMRSNAIKGWHKAIQRTRS